MSDEEGRPPGTGSALVAWRLERIEAALRESVEKTVSLNVYNISQQFITEKVAELIKADADEQAARVAEDKVLHGRLNAYEEKQEANRVAIDKNRRQFWLTVAAGVLVAVFSFFGNPLGQYIVSQVTHK